MAWTGDNCAQTKCADHPATSPATTHYSLPAHSIGHDMSIPTLLSRTCQGTYGSVCAKDLVELMMIQNAQMHQVIMNNMTMWVLRSFGCSQAPLAAETIRYPVPVEKEPPEVFHHYYEPAPFPAYVTWMPPPQPQLAIVYQNGADLQDPVPTALQDRSAVPAPSPLGATRTVGGNTPPQQQGVVMCTVMKEAVRENDTSWMVKS